MHNAGALKWKRLKPATAESSSRLLKTLVLCSTKANAIHELTRNDTKHKLWFELFGVSSWIAFLLF